LLRPPEAVRKLRKDITVVDNGENWAEQSCGIRKKKIGMIGGLLFKGVPGI